MNPPAARRPSWFDDIGRLRLAGYLEGATLVTLLFVAVPLKHLADMPQFVSLIGPIPTGFVWTVLLIHAVALLTVLTLVVFRPF